MPDRELQTSSPVTWASRATWLRPELTRWRVALALAVAVTADAFQILLGPIGWFLSDEVIDVVTMIVTSWLIGFHILLLPTFVLESIPLVDMLPTWTGCVIAVVALRRRDARRR
ncbi:MAG TPA: hypothetical protein VIX35_13425 [Vicinamibacterales bacterium]